MTRESEFLDKATRARKELRLALVIGRAHVPTRQHVPPGDVIEKLLDLWIESILKEFANPAVGRVKPT